MRCENEEEVDGSVLDDSFDDGWFGHCAGV